MMGIMIAHFFTITGFCVILSVYIDLLTALQQ